MSSTYTSVSLRKGDQENPNNHSLKRKKIDWFEHYDILDDFIMFQQEWQKSRNKEEQLFLEQVANWREKRDKDEKEHNIELAKRRKEVERRIVMVLKQDKDKDKET